MQTQLCDYTCIWLPVGVDIRTDVYKPGQIRVLHLYTQSMHISYLVFRRLYFLFKEEVNAVYESPNSYLQGE